MYLATATYIYTLSTETAVVITSVAAASVDLAAAVICCTAAVYTEFVLIAASHA